jgi:hypothetical protein
VGDPYAGRGVERGVIRRCGGVIEEVRYVVGLREVIGNSRYRASTVRWGVYRNL